MDARRASGPPLIVPRGQKMSHLRSLGVFVWRRSVHGHEDSRNRMSTRYVSLDRVRGLKAFRRSSTPEAQAPGWQASLLNDTGESRSRTIAIQNDPALLSQILG